MPHYWKVLGLEETADQRAIKLAYAEKIKAVHPEEDPEGFKALQEAYRQALADARRASDRSQTRTSAAVHQPLYDQSQLFSGLTSPQATESGRAELSEEWRTAFDEAAASSEDSDAVTAQIEAVPQTSLDFSVFEEEQPPVAEEEVTATEGWSELAEQLAGLDQVDAWLEQARAKLGLINRFETCLEVVASYGQLPEAASHYFWNGLGDHVLNMYLFGTWQARQDLASLFLNHACQQAGAYILAVGLTGMEEGDDRDTRLEGWSDQ